MKTTSRNNHDQVSDIIKLVIRCEEAPQCPLNSVIADYICKNKDKEKEGGTSLLTRVDLVPSRRQVGTTLVP